MVIPIAITIKTTPNNCTLIRNWGHQLETKAGRFLSGVEIILYTEKVGIENWSNQRGINYKVANQLAIFTILLPNSRCCTSSCTPPSLHRPQRTSPGPSSGATTL